MMAFFGLRFSNNLVAAGLIAATGAAAFAGGWASDPAPRLGAVTQATRNDWRDIAPGADDVAKDLAVLALKRPWGAPAVDPAAWPAIPPACSGA